jgi:hypothetical protein
MSRAVSNSGVDKMQCKSTAIFMAVFAGLATGLGAAAAHAQANVPDIALKSGETLELGSVYFIQLQNCRSLLLATPGAEILEGPQGVTVTVREGEVVPRAGNCAKKIQGGTLLLKAPQQINDSGFARLVIRVTYKTKDGERKESLIYDLTLLQ